MSLLMAKQTDVRNSTTHPHLHVIAVEKQHKYFSLYISPFFHIVL